MKEYLLKFKWTVSKQRDTYGYNICSLYVDGRKASACSGGGYDMQGKALGNWIARTFEKELVGLTIPKSRRNGQDVQEYYGLTFHDPGFDPGKVKVDRAPVFGKDEDIGKTIDELEEEGKSLGLERYQAFYKGSSSVPDAKHRIPLIDGACGISSVEQIVNAIGFKLIRLKSTTNLTMYRMVEVA